jgi:nuclear pore complex protein Nup93
LWLQLVLIRESKATPSYEKYTLSDFSAKMNSYGLNHFKSISVYFMVLLLCGEFERAVDVLTKDVSFAADGLHFTIALLYLRALKVPKDPSLSSLSGSLLHIQHEKVEFDVARLILAFVKEWGKTDTVDCLQYICCLGLLGGPLSTSNEQQKAYTLLTYQALRDLILTSRQFTEMLGDIQPDGTRISGYIEPWRFLIHLSTNQEFVDQIILKTAQQSESLDKNQIQFSQVVQLYHLAGQYEYVVSLLNRQLSEALMAHQYNTSTTEKELSAQPFTTTNSVELAEQLLYFYQSRPHMASHISIKVLSTCQLLISLHRFMSLTLSSQEESALLLLERLDILSFTSDMSLVQRKVDAFRSLDETVARVIPEILVTAMKCIEKLFNQQKDGRVEELKMKAKGLLMFAGCVQYRIPADVFATLNRLDVMMT